MSLGATLLAAIATGKGAEGVAVPTDSTPELEDALGTALTTARAAWPTLGMSDELFVPYLGARLPADEPAVDAIARARVSDLYLACGVASRVSAAITAFSTGLMPIARGALEQRRLAPALISEMLQAIEAKIVVGGDDGRPKILEYSGKGPLTAWVRVVSVRATLNVLEREQRYVEMEDELLAGASTPDTDPELQHLRERYREEFKQAFTAALGKLTPRDRLMLRQHYVDGLTMDQLASLHGVHRVTFIRRMNRARAEVAAGTRAELLGRLKLDAGEVDSLIRLVRSQIDISLRNFLGPQG